MAKITWKNESKLLDDAKDSKKNDMNHACQESILSNFTCEVRGILYHFSYDQESQINLQDTDRLFQNEMIQEIHWTAYRNEEKVRICLNKKEFTDVYLQGVSHKQNALSHLYESLYPLIEKATTIDMVERIEWGSPSSDFYPDLNKTIEKKLGKIDSIEEESQAQKQVNMQMETIILDVADLALSSMYS